MSSGIRAVTAITYHGIIEPYENIVCHKTSGEVWRIKARLIYPSEVGTRLRREIRAMLHVSCLTAHGIIVRCVTDE
jgi:hypothetical protein